MVSLFSLRLMFSGLLKTAKHKILLGAEWCGVIFFNTLYSFEIFVE
jgi:hypothetical protein